METGRIRLVLELRFLMAIVSCEEKEEEEKNDSEMLRDSIRVRHTSRKHVK